MAKVDNVQVKIITTEDGDRIGLLYDSESEEMITALNLNSEQEMEMIDAISESIDNDMFSNADCDGNCADCEFRDDCDDCMDDNEEEDTKNAYNGNDLKKTIENLVDTSVKQAQEFGKLLKEQGENIASKVNKEDINDMIDELKSNTESLIEKNREILSKYAPSKEDIKKVLDKVSSHASTFIPHNSETAKQKGINNKLFRALENENENITVCLKAFNGVGEDALKGLTTVYCKVNGKFTDPYEVFEGEDDQVTWEANHLQQVGEMLANIDYTKLVK